MISNNTGELINLYHIKVFQARRNGLQQIDLKAIAYSVGERDLYRIGLASRQLAAELGNEVRLECSIDGVILWLN